MKRQILKHLFVVIINPSSLSEINTEIENVDSTINTCFRKSNALINQQFMPNRTTTRTSILEFLKTSTSEIIGGIVEINGIVGDTIGYATASRAVISATLGAIGTDLAGLDYGIGRILFNLSCTPASINATGRGQASGVYY